MRLARKVTASRSEDDGGFTLIELMVVVLIIAILIAIAIPTFLGARSRAQDRAAQSDLRNALTAEKTYYADKQTYSATTATMKAIEPSLKWGAALTVKISPDTLSVCVQEKSKSGTVFGLLSISAGVKAGRYFGKVACRRPVNGTVTAGYVGSW